MADKSDSSQQEEDKNASTDHIDICSVALLRPSVPPTSSRCSYDRNRRACNLDLSNSPCLRPGSAARDSGYNTDVSPAATISPATNTSRQQHFVFDNISQSQVPELEDRLLSVAHIPPYVLSGNIANASQASGSQPPFRLLFEERSRSTPPLRLSPDIFRISASPQRAARPRVQASSRAVSESSDTHRGQYDFDSENEEDSHNLQSSNVFGNQVSGQPKRAADNREASGVFLGLQLPVPSQESDDEDDDDVFYRSDVLKDWGVAPEPQAPKCRSSVSLRRRRYCSTNDDNGSLLGACGGYDLNDYTHACSPSQSQEQLKQPCYDSDQEHQNDELQYEQKSFTGCELDANRGAPNILTFPQRERSFTSSQGFQPSFRETPASRNNSENIFKSDPYDTDSDNDTNTSRFRPNRHAPELVLQERSLHHPVPRSRCRRINVTACLRLSSGSLLPWSSTTDRVSVSTQTPHATSIMIQQILDTPVPFPNEARGTAANLLRRRQSDGAILQPQGSRPLPDIVPPERGRSMSVSDVQTMIRMHRAREVGRELRRLSDDFHFRILLPAVHEESGGLFSRITLFTNSFTNIVTFLRRPFRRPPRPPVSRSHSTSVDFVSSISSISEHPEDLPGD